ncbi:MAG: histidine triad nucleotide-binding protein [Clostridia bacterium]|nr:histidine triad nucleotide-binding protein [Clostridia bacterium]
MDDCIFCKLANNENGNFVYDDENVVAFDDINPVAPVHVLIVPKKHIQDIASLEEGDEKYVVSVTKAIKEVARIKGVLESGFRIINNCGVDAGQTVNHLHFHLIGGKSLGEKII